MNSPLDLIDQSLLELLQANGRIKQNALAEKTGLSVPAVGERLKKLEELGIITDYRAILNYRKLGFDVTAFIAVTVDSSHHYKLFLQKVESTHEIMECHAITGEGTHLLKARTENTSALEKLLAHIQSWPGVVTTLTRVVLSSPKETTHIHIQQKNHLTPQGGSDVD